MSDSTHYIAGTCNIGGAEVRQRRNAAILSAVTTLVLVGLVLATGADRIIRIGLFLPLLGSVVTFEQARRRFCLAYGWRGVFSFEQLGRATRVEDDFARKADRDTVKSILTRAMVIALAATIGLYLIP